jgi:hypothetical protein
MEFQFVEETSKFINQVGFPTFVAVYSLIVLNKTLKKNTSVMELVAAKMGVYTKDE